MSDNLLQNQVDINSLLLPWEVQQDPGTCGEFLCSSLKVYAFLSIILEKPNDGEKS